MKRTVVVSMLAVLAIAPMSARADMVYYTDSGVTMGFGTIEDGGSWFLPVNAGLGGFDLVAAKIASAGDILESPDARNFSKSGWSMLVDQPTLAAFAGPTTSNLSWRMYFVNDLDKNVTIDWAIFNGQNRVWTSRYTIVNGSLSQGLYEPHSQYWLPTREQVPLPGAVLLGMLGLGAAGVRLRRGV